MSKGRAVADVAGSVAAVFLSVWLYEIGNWVSLTAAGAKVSFAWGGVLPVGVFAVTDGGSGFLGAKLLQVGMIVSVTLAALILLRNREFRLTSMTLGGLLGIYVSSVYWEVLSLNAYVPIALNETIYAGLCVATGALFLKALGPGPKYPSPLNR